MKQIRILMGMPVTIEVIDKGVKTKDINDIYSYFEYIDNKFSTFKKNSEITQINEGSLKKVDYSHDMKTVLRKCELTRNQTKGYFDINHNGKLDPSGLVKGWAILKAANLLKAKGFKNYYVDAGGDIQVAGKNRLNKDWQIGIRNPFNTTEIVKTISLKNKGIATSGTYERGNHIYNPKGRPARDIISITVIGPNIYEADRFATAAFAMGKKGIYFLESLKGFEGYMIAKSGLSTQTSGFDKYVT